MRPKIGLLVAMDDDRNASLKDTYVRAVESSGGIPVLLPYTEDLETLSAFAEDGVIEAVFFGFGAISARVSVASGTAVRV